MHWPCISDTADNVLHKIRRPDGRRSETFPIGKGQLTPETAAKGMSVSRRIQGKTHPEIVSILEYISSIYLEQGEKEKAAEYLEKSQELKRQNNDEVSNMLQALF